MKEFFAESFAGLEDTRCPCDITHKLVDVLTLVMCAVLCKTDELDEIVLFGKERFSFLNEHFGVETIPSKSTLTRILNMVDGDKMAECVVGIMLKCIGADGEIVAVDGKTICSTAKKGSWREKIHILTAYLTENGVTLGQLSVNEKTNEIPIFRELLEMIDIKGKIITADAMHCQTETVAKIISGGGDYVLGLKGNQGTAFTEIPEYIEGCKADATIEVETARTVEKNRNRLEERVCHKAPSLGWFEDMGKWAGLKSAFSVYRRTIVGDKIQEETSYYISSLDVSAERILEIVREHWRIESMHWQLDVVFGEDDCRILSSNGQKTLNVFRKMALAFHRRFVQALPQKTKPSIKGSMFRALLSGEHLLNVLGKVV